MDFDLLGKWVYYTLLYSSQKKIQYTTLCTTPILHLYCLINPPIGSLNLTSKASPTDRGPRPQNLLAAFPENLVGPNRNRGPTSGPGRLLTDDEDYESDFGSGDDYEASGFDEIPDPDDPMPCDPNPDCDPQNCCFENEPETTPPQVPTTERRTTTSTTTTTTTTTTRTTSTTTTTTSTTTSTTTTTTTTTTTKRTTTTTEKPTTTSTTTSTTTTTTTPTTTTSSTTTKEEPKMWENQIGSDCFVYYRVHLNFGSSIPLGRVSF